MGISTDDVATQAKFAKAQKLGYRLLSDPDGHVATRYGVLIAGRRMARRVTFIIDPEGRLRHVVRKVSVRRHGAEVAEIIGRLKKASGNKKGSGGAREN